MKIKAIIFDMDGVLIEAKDWHYKALNQSLELFGYTIHRHEHLTEYDGLPTKVKLERLSLEKGLPKSLHSFINEMKQQYTINLIHKYCRPRFNHEYALSRIKSEGYKIALASNSIKMTINLMMEKAKLNQYFDLILSNQDVQNPKPDPEIYISAINHLELRPEECLIIEDNENGIRAAKASGANVMFVRSVEDVNYEAIIKTINSIERS